MKLVREAPPRLSSFLPPYSAGAMFVSGQKAAYVALNALRRSVEQEEAEEEGKPLVAA